jgi:hypothetical protein
MTRYSIVPNGDGSGFSIAVLGADGARQTMLGFSTEAEAEAWIAQDKRLGDSTEASPEYQDVNAND